MGTGGRRCRNGWRVVAAVEVGVPLTVPASFGGQNCRITINLAVIDALQAEIPVTCEDAMQWVNDDFADHTVDPYMAIGPPELCLMSGWAIFSQLLVQLQE
jgi:hypothetical protein